MLRVYVILAIVIVAASCSDLLGKVVLEPKGQIVLSVDPQSNTASGLFSLHNQDAVPAQVRIYASDFKSLTQGKGLNAHTTFSTSAEASAKTILEAVIPAESSLLVRVDVSNLWEAGESKATLYIGRACVGSLVAVKYRPAFNVAIGGGLNEVIAEPGVPLNLTLVNTDNMTYVVSSKLTFHGVTVNFPTTIIPPTGQVVVNAVPPEEWFSEASVLRDISVDGTIALENTPDTTVASGGWPSRSTQLHMILRRAPLWRQKLVVSIVVVGLLGLGGLCSLLLANWIPNVSRRLIFIKSLARCQQRTDGISDHVPSKVVVAIGVRREQLKTRLFEGTAVTADYSAQLDDAMVDLAILVRHVELAVRLDQVLTEVDAITLEQVSPTLVHVIDAEALSANGALGQYDANVEDLNEAERHVTAAAAALARMKSPQSDVNLAGQLAKRCDDLLSRLFAGGKFISPFDVVQAQIPGIMDALLSWKARLGTIAPTDYSQCDVGLYRVEALERFFLHPSPSRDPLQERLFLALRDLGALRMYRETQQVFAELADGVTLAEIISAISQDGSIRINHFPANVVRLEPVVFEVCFHDRRLDRAAAKNDVICEWDLGHDCLEAQGWKIVHFFPFQTKKRRPRRGGTALPEKATGGDKEHLVKAWFRRPDGAPINWAAGSPQSGRREEWVKFPIVPARPRSGSGLSGVQFIHLGVAMAIALIGLIAGAREQFAKLSPGAACVGVFMLGFTADAVRNALTSRVIPPAPTPATDSKK